MKLLSVHNIANDDCPLADQVRWNGIDFIKGIACIAVVFIHVHFPHPLGRPVVAASRFAVPLFLVISGFFFTSHGTCSLASTARKLRHALILSLVSTVALSVLAIAQGLLDPSSSAFDFISSHATVKDVASFFITNAPPPPLVHLWFVWALVYCYLFALLWFADGKRIWTAGILGLTLLIGMTLVQEFSRFLPFPPMIPLRGMPIKLFVVFLFRALPFFLIGIWLRKHMETARCYVLPTWAFAAIALTGGVMAIVELKQFGISQFYIGNYLMVAAMSVWAIKNPRGGWGPMVYIGRHLSLLIYVLHIAVRYFLMIALRGLDIDQTFPVRCIFPVMVVALSLIVAFVIDSTLRLVRSRS